jgi:CheY-like chemotaxis protein
MKVRFQAHCSHPSPLPYSPMSLQISESRFAIDCPAASPCVLLVDDESAVRMAIHRFFARRRWNVVEAVDGETARAILEPAVGFDFDLVICDLHMPRLSGRGLYEWLARTRPDAALKVVFSTGGVVSPEVAEFLCGAGRPLLPKPFELSELARIVEQVRTPARAA